jgi:hypothetical protein
LRQMMGRTVLVAGMPRFLVWCVCVSFFFSYLLLRETKEGRKRVISVTQRTAPFKSLFFYSFLSWIITEPFSGALRLSSSFPLSFCLDVSWEPPPFVSTKENGKS